MVLIIEAPVMAPAVTAAAAAVVLMDVVLVGALSRYTLALGEGEACQRQEGRARRSPDDTGG